MELVVLGSGTAVPHPDRGAAGYALRLRAGVLLMDTGPGSYRRWPANGIRGDEVRWIATTHHHVDHSSDLPAILFSYRVPAAARPDRLTLYGPPGHAAFVRSLGAVWRQWLDADGYTREVVELPEDGRPATADGFTIAARQMLHTQPAVGYRVEAVGLSFAYSGDSGECEALVDLCRDVDLALLDCSMPDGRGAPGHMTPSEAGRVAARAGARRLVLCHLYPACDGIDVAAQARAQYPGEVLVAFDGMRLVLG